MNWINKTLGQLSLLKKFVLIVVPLVVALAAMYWNYLSVAGALIEATDSEYQGTQFTIRQMNLLKDLQSHRGLSGMIIAGDQSAKTNRDSLAQKLDEGLNSLAKDLPEQWGKSRESAQALIADWSTLKNKLSTLDGQQSFEEHSTLIKSLLKTMRWTADESTLTLDPEMGTYYLMSTINFQIPTVVEKLATIRGSLAAMVARGEADATTLGRAHATLDIATIISNEVRENVQKAKSNGVSVQSDTELQAEQVLRTLPNVDALIKKLANADHGMTGPAVFEQVSAPLNGLLQIQDQLNTSLQQALQARIARERGNIGKTTGQIAVLLLAAAFVIVMVIRKVNGDIRTLENQSNSLAKLNLGPTPVLEGKDEMAQISNRFENIRRSQSDMIVQIKELSGGLASNTHALSSAVEQVNAGTHEQSDASSTVASSVEELSVSVGQVAEHSDTARNLARETGAASSQGIEQVGHMRSTMSGIAESSQQLSNTVMSLDQRSEGISSIVQTIQEIAEQTNLLALNAAIEAARAGEHGRGFAVVADEVRTLAERTSSATHSISDLVRGIQDDSRAVVDNVKGWRTEIADGIERSAHVEQAIQLIMDRAQRTETSINEINHAMKEQSQASVVVAKNIERIAQMTDENLAATTQVKDVANDVKAAAERLSGLVGGYKV